MTCDKKNKKNISYLFTSRYPPGYYVSPQPSSGIACARGDPLQTNAMYCTFFTSPQMSFGHTYLEHIYDPNRPIIYKVNHL